MTADQFIWWLRGYLAASVVEKNPLAFGDVKVIQEAIDRVGPAPAPAPTPSPQQSVFDKPFPNKCPRCNQHVSLGAAHFCNGALTP